MEGGSPGRKQELGSGARVPTWQEALELLSSETPGWGGRTPKSAKQPVLERGRKGSLHGGLPEGGGIWRCRTSRTPPRPKDRRTAAEAAAPTRPPPFPEPGRPGRGAGADRKAPSPARPPPPGGPYPRRYLHVGRRGLMAPGPRSALRARVRAAAMETGLCVAEEGPERAGAAGPAPDGEGTEGRRVRPGFGPRAAPFLCPLLPQDGAAPTVKTLQPGQQPRSAPGSGKSQAWAPGGAPDQPQAAKCPREFQGPGPAPQAGDRRATPAALSLNLLVKEGTCWESPPNSHPWSPLPSFLLPSLRKSGALLHPKMPLGMLH
ncbi:translation initiation factor IF-2-like isoform X1 [Elephas maximus indicus]|uniref:translation initiation factor IF-2-like isoform X1 n=1 Tax=Elephas maximus indicus TaxID=99487 RepID=UPI0021162F99|nr:translation initiation factor IF-2-like isoform X1 [Elephas maximus indicus]